MDDVSYVAATYRTPAAALSERLGLAPWTEPKTSLKSLAEREGVSSPEYARTSRRRPGGVRSSPLGPRQLKHVKLPVEVYEVEGANPESTADGVPG